MGVLLSKHASNDYLVKIYETSNLQDLHKLETQLLADFHWSNNDDTPIFSGLLEYVRFKIERSK